MPFTTSISQDLVNFIRDTHTALNPVDLDTCINFVSERGVNLKPSVLEQVEDILTFTLA